MGKSVSYHSYLMQALKILKRTSEAAIDENDLELLQDVVNDVIEAIGDHLIWFACKKAKQVLNVSSGIYK